MITSRCIVLAAALAALALACSKKDDGAADAAAEAAVVLATPADAAPAAPDTADATVTTPLKVAPKPTATARVNQCPAANQAAFVGSGGAKDCEVTCNTNQDCRGGKQCTGSGTLMNTDGSRGGTMKFCR